MAPYKLSSTLKGHQQDIKGVVSPIIIPSNNNASYPVIFSVSRDSNAITWTRRKGASSQEDDSMQGVESEGKSGGSKGGEWTEEIMYKGGHEGFINAVAWAKKVDGQEGLGDGVEGLLLTSGADSLIQAWPYPLPSSFSSSDSVSPVRTLIGHLGNVCTMNVSPGGKVVVSGSWDKSAILWSLLTFTQMSSLSGPRGHSQAVWAVLALDDKGDRILTAGADNLIKLWNGNGKGDGKGEVLKDFKGHTQAVRALTLLGPDVGGGEMFASGGNDGSIRLWTLSGDAVSVLNGHDSFVYSLASLPNGDLVSGGEDRSVRVWKADDGTLSQTITIPAISIWTVSTINPSSTSDSSSSSICAGDIVAGSSDGVVRVFSNNEGRWESEERLKEWDEEVAAIGINAQELGGINKTDLKGKEALLNPGQKEGQVMMIKTEAGAVEAHQWSVASRTWQKIGQVVDAIGSNRRQLFNGKEYDYVFDVDVKEGAPPLKLPYNAADNPYGVAQKFLQDNELPASYLDQVVEFIEKNTAGVQLGTGTSNYADPFTGAARYQPTAGGGSGGGGGDPYTGAGRYQPSATPSAPGGGGGWGGDPFTGSGAYSTQPQAPPPSTSSTSSLLPHRKVLSFLQPPNLTALRTKVVQLSEGLATSNPSLSLSPAELSALDQLIAFLTTFSSITGTQKAMGLDEPKKEYVELAKKIGGEWPIGMRFPGLDITRLLFSLAPSTSLLPTLVLSLSTLSSTSDGTPKDRETNSMLSLRGLANGFGTQRGVAMMQESGGEVAEALAQTDLSKLNKNGKIAASTVVLNFSVLAVSDALEPKMGEQLVGLAAKGIQDTDPEVNYRSLVAIGNLLLSSTTRTSISQNKIKEYRELVRSKAVEGGDGMGMEDRIKGLGREVLDKVKA